MAKSERPSKEFILREIIKLRVKKGYSRWSVVNHLKSKYDYSRNQGYLIYKEASVEMGKLFARTNDVANMESIILLQSMTQKALEEGDDKLALDVIKEINKCLGMYVHKVELDSKVPITINIS